MIEKIIITIVCIMTLILSLTPPLSMNLERILSVICHTALSLITLSSVFFYENKLLPSIVSIIAILTFIMSFTAQIYKLFTGINLYAPPVGPSGLSVHRLCFFVQLFYIVFAFGIVRLLEKYTFSPWVNIIISLLCLIFISTIYVFFTKPFGLSVNQIKKLVQRNNPSEKVVPNQGNFTKNSPYTFSYDHIRAQEVSPPLTFDPRVTRPNFISPVMNQGQCGDCVFFSTSGMLADRWALAKGIDVEALSVQYMISCAQNSSSFVKYKTAQPVVISDRLGCEGNNIYIIIDNLLYRGTTNPTGGTVTALCSPYLLGLFDTNTNIEKTLSVSSDYKLSVSSSFLT